MIGEFFKQPWICSLYNECKYFNMSYHICCSEGFNYNRNEYIGKPCCITTIENSEIDLPDITEISNFQLKLMKKSGKYKTK